MFHVEHSFRGRAESEKSVFHVERAMSAFHVEHAFF